VYKLLPQTNCKQCGEPTCYTFALKLAASQKKITDCPPLCEPPAAPDGSTAPAVPCSSPCEQPDPESLVHPCAPVEPCASPDRLATEPEGEKEECAPAGGGTSGSSSSGIGIVEPVEPIQ